MKGQRRLIAEIWPHLLKLEGRPWTPEEVEFLSWMEKHEGRPLTDGEKRIAVAQARMIGEIQD
jgi:hypothetical protein